MIEKSHFRELTFILDHIYQTRDNILSGKPSKNEEGKHAEGEENDEIEGIKNVMQKKNLLMDKSSIELFPGT